jgi:hypothetical protein
VIGGEIADTRFRIRRRVRSDDPADLGAPLSYSVEVVAADNEQDLDPAAAAYPVPPDGPYCPAGRR